MKPYAFLKVFAAVAATFLGILPGTVVLSMDLTKERDLQTTNTNSPYFTTTNLGTLNNYDVTLGNPLRGLGGDANNNNAHLKSKIKFSIEVFYYPFSKIVVGKNQYDWTDFEAMLNRVKSRNNHGIPRFYIDYPGNPLALPQYLIDTAKFYNGGYSGKSPYYDDPNIVAAMKDFIFALAAKYDGDQRLAMIQAGLLGYWAEWHCGDLTKTVLPDWVGVQVMQWYDEAFSKTPIQVRYPRKDAYDRKFGFYDDSFTWSTLDGPYNGGVYKSWFTEPEFRKLNISDFWKTAPMGGEVRPENVATVFEPTYPAGTVNKQDFYACSQLTHTTYMKVGGVIGDYAISQAEADKANWNCARMGYSFQATSVAVRASMTDATKVDIDVVVENNGIAPFYYPLDMLLNCSGVGVPHRISGVETIIDKQSAKTLQYKNVPATTECLNKLTFTFDSKMLYPGRPIKFSQGDGTLNVKVPLPPNASPTTPVAPVPVPIRSPTQAPVVVPVPVPVPVSTQSPTNVIQSFILKDVGTFKEYPLTDFTTINLAQIGTKSLTIVAQTKTNTGIKVEFTWIDSSGIAQKRVENGAPWTMGGDSGAVLSPVGYLGIAGTKSVTATAYSTVTGGVVGTTTVRFTVIDGSVPTAPVTPTKAPTNKPNQIATNAPVGVSGNSFTSFVLKDVSSFKEYVLSQGITINLSVIGTSPLTLVAKTASNSNIRVEFGWKEENGITQSRVEGAAPWSMGGDVGGTSFGSVPFLIRPGTKIININAVSTTTGAVVASATVNFNVVTA